MVSPPVLTPFFKSPTQKERHDDILLKEDATTDLKDDFVFDDSDVSIYVGVNSSKVLEALDYGCEDATPNITETESQSLEPEPIIEDLDAAKEEITRLRGQIDHLKTRQEEFSHIRTSSISKTPRRSSISNVTDMQPQVTNPTKVRGRRSSIGYSGEVEADADSKNQWKISLNRAESLNRSTASRRWSISERLSGLDASERSETGSPQKRSNHGLYAQSHHSSSSGSRRLSISENSLLDVSERSYAKISRTTFRRLSMSENSCLDISYPPAQLASAALAVDYGDGNAAPDIAEKSSTWKDCIIRANSPVRQSKSPVPPSKRNARRSSLSEKTFRRLSTSERSFLDASKQPALDFAVDYGYEDASPDIAEKKSQSWKHLIGLGNSLGWQSPVQQSKKKARRVSSRRVTEPHGPGPSSLTKVGSRPNQSPLTKAGSRRRLTEPHASRRSNLGASEKSCLDGSERSAPACSENYEYGDANSDIAENKIKKWRDLIRSNSPVPPVRQSSRNTRRSSLTRAGPRRLSLSQRSSMDVSTRSIEPAPEIDYGYGDATPDFAEKKSSKWKNCSIQANSPVRQTPDQQSSRNTGSGPGRFTRPVESGSSEDYEYEDASPDIAEKKRNIWKTFIRRSSLTGAGSRRLSLSERSFLDASVRSEMIPAQTPLSSRRFSLSERFIVGSPRRGSLSGSNIDSLGRFHRRSSMPDGASKEERTGRQLSLSERLTTRRERRPSSASTGACESVDWDPKGSSTMEGASGDFRKVSRRLSMPEGSSNMASENVGITHHRRSSMPTESSESSSNNAYNYSFNTVTFRTWKKSSTTIVFASESSDLPQSTYISSDQDGEM